MTFVSIAASGVAKSLVAVTISLHPGAAQPARHDIMVQRGDSLSAISLHEYGTAAEWPALWWANRRQVPDPSMIVSGERLIVPSGLRVSRWLVRAAQAATAAPRHAAAAAVARPASGASVSGGAEVADTVASAAARRATPSGAGLVPDEGAVQELAAASADPAFGDRVHVWRPHVAQHGPDARIGEDAVESNGEV